MSKNNVVSTMYENSLLKTSSNIHAKEPKKLRLLS